MTSVCATVLAHEPGRLAINDLTYGDVAARVRRVAAGLCAAGVGAGDRVAVLAHNTPETLVLLLACSAIGALLVPLNWRLAVPELQYILADATPRLLWLDRAHAHLAAALGGVTVLPGADGPVPQGDNAAPLLLIYTSGTTGRPKGAVLTGAALRANAALSQDMHALSPEDHVLTVLPLFHVGGLNIQTTPALLLGARVTLHPRFDPGNTLAAIATLRPTLTVLVPATLQACHEHPDWAATDLSSLRVVTTGSTIVAAGLVLPWQARGVPVLQVYGSTETCPIAIYQRLGEASTGTGRPGPGVDAHAHEGEIVLRGPQLFQGYWRQPPALDEGWYRTGDLGSVDSFGCWTIHDRRSNLIISGGENVYPAEIERVLREHPAVRDAAVAGEPDPRWGTVPIAYVECRAPVSDAVLLAFVRSQLARFKVPRRIEFVDALPRNAMGKVVRDRLAPAKKDTHSNPHSKGQGAAKPSPSGGGLGGGEATGPTQSRADAAASVAPNNAKHHPHPSPPPKGEGAAKPFRSGGGLGGGEATGPTDSQRLSPLAFARALRRNPSLAERILWRAVRQDALGFRVKRQFPLGPFILDFVVHRARLAIEIDGETHSDAKAYDDARTRWLGDQGWRVVRFTNSEVATNLEGVLLSITAAARC